VTPQELVALLTLLGVKARMADRENVRDWIENTQQVNIGDLTPAGATGSRTAAYERHRRQAASPGPKIMWIKRQTALGSVTWGTGDDEAEATVDETLEALDLPLLAREAHYALVVDGIVALLAYEPEEGAEPRLTQLGGYLEPYYDPNDRSRMTGLFQSFTRTVNGELRYFSRIWDWEDSEPDRAVLREWDNLDDPTKVGGVPTNTVEDGPRPRLRIYGRTPAGLVTSPIMQVIELMQAYWATSMRLVAVEEFALPVLFGKGSFVTDPDGRLPAFYPGSTYKGGENSSLEFLQLPTALSELREQRRERANELREALGLPGGFLGSDTPSGEALAEAKENTVTAAEYEAGLVQDVLTEAVGDYAALRSVNGPPVVVNVNERYRLEARFDRVGVALERDLIPRAVAVREIQPLFPTFSDDERNAFLAQPAAPSRGALREALRTGGLDDENGS
jgi:hypothetical protein